MKIYFLGTNGWYDTETGNTLCILVETKKEYIVLDAGNGIYKIDRYIKSLKPIYVFISHFHLDHIIGFHALAKFKFRQGISIYGPPGLKKIFATFIKNPYTIPINKLKTKITVEELKIGSRLPINCEFRKLWHSTICYGYRFYLDRKILTFGTDTGVCQNLYLLAKNADLLIAECAYKSQIQDKNWPHLNPESAARIAKKANAKKLALVHFDAAIYKTLKERKEAERLAKHTFKNTVSAYDNLRIEL